jgi:hypothetical protein
MERPFVDAITAVLPRDVSLFRDLGKERLYWVPRRWDIAHTSAAWHAEVELRLSDLVASHTTHRMETVDRA